MTGVKALVGSATRYIAGRNAVQTVYWRGSADQQTSKFIKVSKTLQFKAQPQRSIREAHNSNNTMIKFD